MCSVLSTTARFLLRKLQKPCSVIIVNTKATRRKPPAPGKQPPVAKRAKTLLTKTCSLASVRAMFSAEFYATLRITFPWILPVWLSSCASFACLRNRATHAYPVTPNCRLLRSLFKVISPGRVTESLHPASHRLVVLLLFRFRNKIAFRLTNGNSGEQGIVSVRGG